MPKVFSEAVDRLVFWALAGKQTAAKANANAYTKPLVPLFDQRCKLKKEFVMQFFLRLCTL